MNKIKIVFITGNENKCKEVNAILGINLFSVINIKLDLPEIQSMNVVDVVNEKIKITLQLAINNFNEIIEKFKLRGEIVSSINDVIILCEDTGLTIKNMNNFPGALIKFYYESIGNKGISERDGGSLSIAICVIGIILYGKIHHPIIGTQTGSIAYKPTGDNGFGWDQIFIPDLSLKEYNEYTYLNGKTYAELDKNIKDNISHRSIAFNMLKKIITAI